MTGEASWARDYARRVLAHEAKGSRDPEGLVEAADHAYQRLYATLVPLIGPRGPDAVLARALKRAAAEFPFLTGIAPTTEQGKHLLELQAKVRGLDHAQVSAGLTALLAEYLSTLVGLLGREPCDKFVQRAWPEIGIGE